MVGTICSLFQDYMAKNWKKAGTAVAAIGEHNHIGIISRKSTVIWLVKKGLSW